MTQGKSRLTLPRGIGPYSGTTPRIGNHELLGVPGKTIERDSVEPEELPELSQRGLKSGLDLVARQVNERAGEVDQKLFKP